MQQCQYSEFLYYWIETDVLENDEDEAVFETSKPIAPLNIHTTDNATTTTAATTLKAPVASNDGPVRHDSDGVVTSEETEVTEEEEGLMPLRAKLYVVLLPLVLLSLLWLLLLWLLLLLHLLLLLLLLLSFAVWSVQAV